MEYLGLVLLYLAAFMVLGLNFWALRRTGQNLAESKKVLIRSRENLNNSRTRLAEAQAILDRAKGDDCEQED